MRAVICIIRVRTLVRLSASASNALCDIGNLMRLKDTQEQLNYLRDAVKFGHINYVLEGLNILGSTPWKVNRDVFDIVLKVWNSGEGFEKIPEANYSEPEPVKPEDYDTNVEAKSQYMQAYRQWQLGKSNNHSSRCSVNYKVEIARTVSFFGFTDLQTKDVLIN